MRGAGTARALASALALMPSGTRKSSRRTSPGWIGRMPFLYISCRSSVVVHDRHLLGTARSPAKADPGRVVDADGVLPLPFAPQRSQPIARGRSKECQGVCGIQLSKFPHGHLRASRVALRAASFEQLPCFPVAEAPYHSRNL